MAASKFSREEVLRRLDEMETESDSDSSVHCTTGNEDSIQERVSKCLSGFLREEEGLSKERREAFVESATSALLPLYELATNHQMGFAGAGRFLTRAPVYAGTVLKSESNLWLQRIHRRLSRRCSIRHPFFAEIRRDIPYEIFSLFVRFIRNAEGFARPFCSYTKSTKTEIVSLSSIRLTKELFVLLSGLQDGEVASHFKRTLNGLKTGHKVSLIVNNEKEFSFKYDLKRCDLTLSFYYGEWNPFGYPQHN